jgi:hypothetical protein
MGLTLCGEAVEPMKMARLQSVRPPFQWSLKAYPKTEGGPRLAPSAHGFSDRFLVLDDSQSGLRIVSLVVLEPAHVDRRIV